jgi:2-iminobutanoate/2-iminopropanoate deaminase
MMRETLHTDDLNAPLGVFVQAVKVSAPRDLIFVSGLTSRRPDGSIIGIGDVRTQTRQILENLKRILATGGATLDDIVKVTVFIRNMEDFPAIHEIRREYFTNNRPASSMVQVSRLVDEDLLIEIEAIAALH